jgi:hypothetical protein
MATFALPHSRSRVGAALDRELARGLDPGAVPERETRARWITSPARCERLASAFERLIADAERPSRSLSAGAPIRRNAVIEAREQIFALAAGLRAADRPPAAAVARARTLLTDCASPIYGDTGESLQDVAQDICCALECRRTAGESRAATP